LTFSGAARYNIANVLAAVPLARALGIPLDAIRSALAEFSGGSAINPGRGNLFELGGVRVLVDFAHNPHGMHALAELVTALPAKRRLLVLGQAGDRDDASIRALAQEALEIPLDRIIIKEMTKYLRGRAEGEVPALIEETLGEAGVPGERVRRAEDEIDALHQALDWSRPGDLLIFPVHAQREEVLDMLERLSSAAWSPGQKLPL
jgi:UDP-N-acetylmuramyl tripeptide synthase